MASDSPVFRIRKNAMERLWWLRKAENTFQIHTQESWGGASCPLPNNPTQALDLAERAAASVLADRTAAGSLV